MTALRKSESTVKRGRFQHTENRRYTPGAEALAGTSVVLERHRPGKGYRHILKKSDIERFIGLLPDWDEVSVGLETIVLLEGQDDLEGWYGNGWIGICAWTRAMWHQYDGDDFFKDRRASIFQIGVPLEEREGRLIGKWTEEKVRAYQLLDVLVHELGHHHDRMTTTSWRVSRGEGYAEDYAAHYANRIWQAYCDEFGFVPDAGHIGSDLPGG